MTWLFGYLLVGFVLDWAAPWISGEPRRAHVEWYWDLSAIVFWPLTLAFALREALAERRRRRS
ncbi:MAG: hypothetical protein M5U08_13815 [Burkholderiales bacterium]|nr:hypothetical protein [Burkholderiales bacterium]